MKISIGVDPGQAGAYACIKELEGIAEKQTRPWDEESFVNAMIVIARIANEAGANIVACVEKVGATPQMGVTSAFSFGRSAGFIEGVLSALKIPYQKISPQMWKKEFSLIVSGAKLGDTEKKAKSIETCKRLFPNVTLKKSERCTTDSDGMAEALLMAEYARRKL